MKVFQSVNEIDEEIKNDSDESEPAHGCDYSRLKKNQYKVKGILALTKENLRKLDLKNQVCARSNLVQRREYKDTLVGEMIDNIEKEESKQQTLQHYLQLFQNSTFQKFPA